MPSSIHNQSSNSDNSRADEQQQSESHSPSQSESPANGIAHSNMPPLSTDYVMPLQPGVGHAVAPAYPYPDPYYRSIFSPYAAQPMVHPHLMGVQAAVPLPSDAIEEPVYVNAKQYHGILRRRQSRAKAESENKLLKCRKPYLHESRHQHALRRARGCGGRFLNAKPGDNEENKVASDNNMQPDTENPGKTQNAPSQNSA